MLHGPGAADNSRNNVIAAAARALYRAKGRPETVELEFLAARAEPHDRERRTTTPGGDP